MPATSPPRAWAEVDLNAIKHNLDILRLATPDTMMMPVIKAGAYGHGLERVARHLDHEGIPFLGVANVGEARLVKQSGCSTKPYILGACFAEEREEVIANDWCSFISTYEDANHYNSLARLYGKKAKLHISTDLGMGRGGFLPEEIPALLDKLPEWQNINIEGIATHLPGADEDQAATFRNIETFKAISDLVQGRINIKYKHIAASAGMLDYSIPFANLARPGLALYGYSPIIENPLTQELKCALTLKARVSIVRTIPPGHGVSYGSTFITDRPMRVATVGIGYADGYFRSLSGKGARVFYHGGYAPVLGRVTMDQIMVDASFADHPESGDIVEVLGPNITAYELATLAGTIPWEILTAIGPRVPRVY